MIETEDGYQSFLASKRTVAQTSGIDVSLDDIHPMLFDFQKVIVRWSLQRGRSAIWADCFLPGALVWANGKYRLIEECQIGMQIETLQGPALIERFIEKDYDGETVEVTTASGFYPLKVTPEHQFYVLRRQRCVIPSRGKNTMCSPECDRKYCPLRGNEPHSDYKIELVTASQLVLDDCLLFRQPTEKEKIHTVEDAYLRMAGYWLAEGNFGTHSSKVQYQVVFNFNIDEEDTLAADTISDLIQLGYKPRTERSKVDRNVLVVVASSRELVTRLKCDFGSLSHGKRLPDWFFELSREKKLILLTALIKGDGHINTRAALQGERLSENIRYTTVSYQLASGVRDALLGMGIRCASMAEAEKIDKTGQHHREVYRIQISRRFMAEFGFDIPVIRRDLRQTTHHENGQMYTLVPIRKLQLGVYSGKVYNLTSSGHDSYLTDAGTSKNCGLGKSFMQCNWSQLVHRHTNRDILILAPLAVTSQTVAEGQKLEISVHPCRSQADVKPGVNITNYEMLGHFDPDHFVGVVADESSILKSYMGRTKRALVDAFKDTPYRLACTATPSPNDVMELLNHAEWLGIMPSSEALMRWFINDTMSNGKYRLKGHAQKDFWQWVSSWAVSLRKPSDLGFSDQGFALPELKIIHKYVETDVTQDVPDGQLFRAPTMSATSIHKEMRLTAAGRSQIVADLVNGNDDTWIIWVNTNYESDAIKALIPDVVEVRGSESIAAKERKLTDFTEGRIRVILTKAEIAGFGLNWQHCHKMVYLSDYSFEKFYQAVRRAFRYGQKHDVEVYLVSADTEGPIIASLERKMRAHVELANAMNANFLSFQEDLQLTKYNPQVPMVLPEWLCSHG